ncbi:MAG TPA: PIN domain-containing protein [Bryobacteraceae bacterium]|jgi:predicted nucleic acid-binding protein|nr:PIN domain-containing protein [Bryobacteraceae bacterium]
MPDRAFFDTNILIYAFSARDRRQNIALALLLAGGTIGIQTLNEFVAVVTGKLKRPWPEAMICLDTIQELCQPPIPATLRVHRHALHIAQASGYHIYDSLMLAAALEASCTVLYTEDMHDGQVIENLTIRNPFG